jgi:PAS domain-containing protein
LLALFHAFSMKSMQIQHAIKSGDDLLVGSLDKELEPLVAAILAYHATNPLEIYMQLQFLGNLIRESADDQSSVVQNCTAFSSLLHRYFAGAEDASMEALLAVSGERPFARSEIFNNDDILSDVVLDSLPDRVAVLTRDYRYVYSNAANNAYLNAKPIDLIGRHIEDVIGHSRFEQRAKAKLDACFSGEVIDYVYHSYSKTDSGRMIRCRMSPLRGAGGKIIGALLTLQDAMISAEAEFIG